VTVNSPPLSVRRTFSAWPLSSASALSSSVLGGQEGDPHVVRSVINHQEEVPAPASSRWCHRAAQVGMDQLQWVLSAVLRWLREQQSALLGDDAGVADLLCVLDDGEAARHGVLAELVQRFEVEVAKPLVPEPVVVVLPCGEADRLRGVEVEHIEAARSAVYLDQETPAWILDAQHAMVDLHLGPAFIKLAQAHDGVAQRRDEVDALQHAMLSVLRLEHDGADALYLHP